LSDLISENDKVNNKTSADRSSVQPKVPKEKALRRTREAEKITSKEAKDKAKVAAKEAKEKAKKEAEESRKAKKLAEEKANMEAAEARERAKRKAIEAEEKTKREAEGAKDQTDKEAFEISITTKSETVKNKKTKNIKQILYKGEVKLLIMPPVDSKNLKELEDGLRNTKGLKLLLIGGTSDGGIQIVVSTLKPMPILNALKETPQVKDAVGKDDMIYISLK